MMRRLASLLPTLTILLGWLAVPATGLAGPGGGVTPPTPILLALRAQAWPLAKSLADANPDPVGGKLVDFIRLLNPGQAGAAEIAAFIAANPSWPDQDTLEKRYGEALADEPDGQLAAKLCASHPPAAAPALLRCADAWSLARDGRAADAARQAWVALAGDDAAEQDLLSRWNTVLTPDDQQHRFDRLLPSDLAAAARQLARLPAASRPLAAARLAFRRRDADALSTLEAVPATQRADPGLLLDEARYLRRTDADAASLALWRTALPAAEAASPANLRPAFWTERDVLARRLIASGDAQAACFLADDPNLPPEQALDAEFLSGWIALQRLHDPARAQAKFAALEAAGHSAITQARAAYWLARASSGPAAQQAYARAAAWPTTYYGQLAARASGESDGKILARIAALRDPPATRADTEALTGTEMARAAMTLVSWADPRRAADFVRQLALAPAPPAKRALVAALALRLGLPDVAVQTARLAGRDGVVLPQAGWPEPVQPPAGTVPPALVLGLMRQESSFDPAIVSAAGAHGLMQLMSGTAAQIARTLHAPAGPLADPDVNMRLGTAYLTTLLDQFGGKEAYAIAAYNAGPHRVHEWIAADGDAADAGALIDWIELIPFAETRNYVQRVLENEMVYRAKAQGAG